MSDVEKPTKMFTIAQAAEQLNISRQAVHFAIRRGRMKCNREKRPIRISKENIDEYNQTLFSRSASKYDGELRHDNSKGFYSPTQLAHLFSVNVQRVYYYIREKKIKATRKGGSWVIHIDDAGVLKK